MSRCRTVCCRYGIPTTVPCKNRESQNYPITRNQTLTLSLTLFPKLKPISLSPGFVGIPPTTCCRSTNPQQIAVVEFATELGFCPTQRTFQRKRRRWREKSTQAENARKYATERNRRKWHNSLTQYSWEQCLRAYSRVRCVLRRVACVASDGNQASFIGDKILLGVTARCRIDWQEDSRLGGRTNHQLTSGLTCCRKSITYCARTVCFLVSLLPYIDRRRASFEDVITYIAWVKKTRNMS